MLSTVIYTCMSLITLVPLIYYYYIKYGRNGRLLNRLPGPPTVPLFGNILGWQTTTEFLWKAFRDLHRDYHPISRLWGFTHCIVNIYHPDDMETILSNNKHAKGFLYTLAHPWLGTGLLTSEGTKWHTRRKILTPAFHFNILQQFVNILVEEGERMTKSLKESEGTVVKDLIPFISEHTLNAICETAMGTSLKHYGVFQQQYRQTVHQMGDILCYRVVRPWLHNDFLFSLTPTSRKHAKNLKILHGFTEKIIAERKLYHQNTDGKYLRNLENDERISEITDDDIGINKKQLAMLDLLIAASKENNLSDSDIREEVDTFMFEGHDTAAMGICFALLLLAEHKDIQDRVRAEVKSVMEETGGKLNMMSLQRLSYLERCLKETLRLYPSVHLISRITAEDVKLQSYVVPAGTHLLIHFYDLHRDPDFWPNPDVFDPDRFLPDNMKNRHSFSYLPFSAGPRNCIGQRYAMLEMKAMIAALVHDFYLEPHDYLKNVRLKLDIVVRPILPVHVKFVPIETI